MPAVVYITARLLSTLIAKAVVVRSQTNVTPFKRLIIPRLELTAVLLLTKLDKPVQSALRMGIRATHLWTDWEVTLTLI